VSLLEGVTLFHILTVGGLLAILVGLDKFSRRVFGRFDALARKIDALDQTIEGVKSAIDGLRPKNREELPDHIWDLP
jgi:hypothetical protein